MKKFIFLFCFLFVSSLSYSQIYVENFDYTAGSLLTTNDAWGATSGAGTIPITVTAPGLVFTDYAGSGIGNAVNLGTAAPASGEDDTARFVSSLDAGSVYISFMVRVDTARTGDYFISILNFTGAATTFVGRVFVKDSTGGTGIGSTIAFGLSKNSGTADLYTNGIYSLGITYLLVLKYTFVAGATNDIVSLFIFSPTDVVPALEPSPTIGPLAPGGTDLGNAGKILLRQGTASSSAALRIDGIYVDGTWNNAVLPVELTSFTATVNRRDVALNWTTASENNNSGFDIERSLVNGQWSMVGNVVGNGTSTTPNNYSYTDRSLASGSYNYRLKQIDLNGNFTYYNLSNEVNVGVPAKFDLSQNYPNPFNPSTKINYDLPLDGNVSIKLFDMSGKEVATLVNEVKTAGYYSVDFNAINIASGIYFYRINAEANGQNFVSTKKMMFVK